jgi:hypothetical protein
MFVRYLGGGVGHRSSRGQAEPQQPDDQNFQQVDLECEAPIQGDAIVDSNDDGESEDDLLDVEDGDDEDDGEDDLDQLGAEDGEDANYDVPEDEGYGAL